MILVEEDMKDEVLAALGDEHRIICTNINKKKADVF